MKKDGFAPGEPCWADCGTDLTTAPAFYKALFGWQLDDMGPDAGGYTIASNATGQVAGFGPQQSPGAPYWSVYFRTDDAAKTAELVRSAKGTVLVEPFEVMEAGTMAVLADPLGAAFCVWQPNQHAGFGAVDEPGTYCWAELVTTDVAAASAFYADVLGVTVASGADASMEYHELKLDDRSVAGMMPKPKEMPAEVPSFWGVYFAVEDTDATLRRVAELGGSTAAGPMDVPVGRFAVCVDPAGAPFSVIALAQV
jgi:predicted enzyme related to lactoylglutathione lyase